MERTPYSPLAPSTEPNPLRPYYRPPSIGSRLPESGIASNNASVGNSATTPRGSSASFGSSARDILSDLNYNEILGDAGQSTGEAFKSILDQALWKYTSVFLAQPFEVAKAILQVRLAEHTPGIQNALRSKHGQKKNSRHRSSARRYELNVDEDGEDDGDEDEDDEDEEISYFSSGAPDAKSYEIPSRRKRSSPPRTPSTTTLSDRPQQPFYRLELRRPDSVTEVISQLWQREGAWGIWKGTNAAFLYSLLTRTFETWTRSLLAAILGLPDPGLVATGGVGGLDIIDSPSPLLSLLVTVAAAGAAGIVLAPLDVVKTRIMLTSTSNQPRSILPCIRSLSTWTCTVDLLAPTLLHSTIPALFSSCTPLLLRNNLRIDPIITPTTYSICTFLSAVAELFIKLPVETVLRRAQIDFVATDIVNQSKESPSSASRRGNALVDDFVGLRTSVNIGPYHGIMPTVWRIMREEGSSVERQPLPSLKEGRPTYAARTGQGVHGLWRGWRVGWWGLVGVWGAAALGGGGKGGEF